MGSRKLTIGLFIAYLLALVWVVVFKLQFTFEGLGPLRSINLIPFAGSGIVNDRIHLSEIIYNLLVFVPYGVFLGMLRAKRRLIANILPIFLTSLAFELLQYVFAIGASDVTDLLGNTLGGVIGIGAFSLLSSLFKERTHRIINIVALIIALALASLMGLLLFANM
jgi:glycopeptide antibiotics resistance protein